MALVRKHLAHLSNGTTVDASTMFAGETFHVVRGHPTLYVKQVPIEELVAEFWRDAGAGGIR